MYLVISRCNEQPVGKAHAMDSVDQSEGQDAMCVSQVDQSEGQDPMCVSQVDQWMQREGTERPQGPAPKRLKSSRVVKAPERFMDDERMSKLSSFPQRKKPSLTSSSSFSSSSSEEEAEEEEEEEAEEAQDAEEALPAGRRRSKLKMEELNSSGEVSEKDKPSLPILCKTEPNPTESLQIPLKRLSVRLVDCRNILGLNMKVIKEEEEEEEGYGDFFHEQHPFAAVKEEEPGDLGLPKERPNTCSDDGNSSSSSKQHKRHHGIQKGKRPYCVNQPANLKIHQRILTEERPYNCSHCGKSFSYSVQLKTHQRTHTGEKPYCCSQCGKSFSRADSLKVYQRIHTGEKPYQCNQCEKSFRFSVGLQRPEKMHTGEKTYHCSQCEKSFSQSIDLKRHQRMHMEKPYDSDCGKSLITNDLTNSGNLQTHQEIHTGDKHYKCFQSGKRFTQLGSFIHTENKAYNCQKGQDAMCVSQVDQSEGQDVEGGTEGKLPVSYPVAGAEEGGAKMGQEEGVLPSDQPQGPVPKRHTPPRPQRLRRRRRSLFGFRRKQQGELVRRLRQDPVMPRKPRRRLLWFTYESTERSDALQWEQQQEEEAHPKTSPGRLQHGRITPGNRSTRLSRVVKAPERFMDDERMSKLSSFPQRKKHSLISSYSSSSSSSSSSSEEEAGEEEEEEEAQDAGEALPAGRRRSKLKMEELNSGEVSEEDKPSLPILCKEEPNPTESLQIPLKRLSVRLEDCRNILGLNIKVIKEEEEEEEEEGYGDFFHEEHQFAAVKEEEPGDLGLTKERPNTSSDDGNSSSASKQRKRHHGIQKGKRPYCVNQPANLKIHQRILTEERPYNCSQCGECYSRADDLKTHQTTHAGEKPYWCSQCGKCFNQESNLTKHQRTHTGEKPYRCSQCGKCLAHSGALKTHQRIHTGEKPYRCSQCQKCFAHSGALKTHQRRHTGEKPYHCSQCEKRFIRVNDLKAHQRIHTGEFFHCSQCGKCFTQSGTLKIHQRTHTGEKPYRCSYCEKGFTHSGALKSHQKVHTGEKPYHCSLCGKRFAQSVTLKIHQKIHTGEKPYRCSYCGECFIQVNDLKTHQKTHTRDLFCCSQCGKYFAYSSTLKRHQTKHILERSLTNAPTTLSAVKLPEIV